MTLISSKTFFRGHANICQTVWMLVSSTSVFSSTQFAAFPEPSEPWGPKTLPEWYWAVSEKKASLELFPSIECREGALRCRKCGKACCCMGPTVSWVPGRGVHGCAECSAGLCCRNLLGTLWCWADTQGQMGGNKLFGKGALCDAAKMPRGPVTTPLSWWLEAGDVFRGERGVCAGPRCSCWHGARLRYAMTLKGPRPVHWNRIAAEGGPRPAPNLAGSLAPAIQKKRVRTKLSLGRTRTLVSSGLSFCRHVYI